MGRHYKKHPEREPDPVRVPKPRPVSGIKPSDTIVIGDVRATIAEHAERNGIPLKVLMARIEAGFPEPMLSAICAAHRAKAVVPKPVGSVVRKREFWDWRKRREPAA